MSKIAAVVLAFLSFRLIATSSRAQLSPVEMSTRELLMAILSTLFLPTAIRFVGGTPHSKISRSPITPIGWVTATPAPITTVAAKSVITSRRGAA